MGETVYSTIMKFQLEYVNVHRYYHINAATGLTMKFPVLFEQAKSLGGWASILSFSLMEVRYSVFPPRAFQNSSVGHISK